MSHAFSKSGSFYILFLQKSDEVNFAVVCKKACFFLSGEHELQAEAPL